MSEIEEEEFNNPENNSLPTGEGWGGAFISREDFITHLYEGQIEAISQDNDDLLNDAIATAMAQAAGYLNRYDLDLIFASTDKVTFANLRTYIKDMAKWHFINICNVNVDFEIAERRYKYATTELEKIQKGQIAPRGWPLQQQPETANTPFSVSSRPKRGNYF